MRLFIREFDIRKLSCKERFFAHMLFETTIDIVGKTDIKSFLIAKKDVHMPHPVILA